MKTIALISLCLLFTARTFATHVASAELRYEYTGTGNDYVLVLSITKACEPFSFTLNSQEIVTIQSPTTIVFSDTLFAISTDTIEPFCIAGSCSLLSSNYAGYERKVYSDTVSLPPNNWTISWNLCCRNYGIVNLANPGNETTYLEAFLDNSVANNTSTYIANPFPFNMSAGSVTTIPLQTVDAENDSVAYEWYQPLSDLNLGSYSIPYAPGYSLTNPIGGISFLDMANQTLVLETPLAGKYALAFKVNEFRNGQLIGWTKRDFQINVINTPTPINSPGPAAGSVMHYTTCPGIGNSVSINFEDSTATDSVYLDITVPSLPGWSFTTVASNGLGVANASISWTTPSTMNPATLPHFYITVYARDNGCPVQANAYYAIVVENTQCATDSVWAGDANGDYTVNIYDPLAIAVAYGQTGPMRPGATTTWQPEFCMPWANAFPNTVNMKHSDCDGDGFVGNPDLAVVSANYGLVHLKHGGPKPKVTGNPDLYFDLTGISFAPGANVSIPIKLGSATNMMNDFYGIGTTITIGGLTLSSPATITYPVSWVGNNVNTISFSKDASGSMDWAYSRINHQNVSGQGTIANLNFTVPANALNNQQITLQFNSTQIINATGELFTDFNEVDATASVVTGVDHISGNIQYAYVIPNPSAAAAVLNVKTSEKGLLNIRVTDVTGRTVWNSGITVGNDESNIALPSSAIAPGMYTIHLSDQKSNVPTVIKWIKQ